MANSTVLLSGVSTSLEVKLRAALPDVDWRTLPNGARLSDVLKTASGSSAVVVLETDLEAGFRLVRDLERASVRVVVVGPTKDADLILRAMREGAKEFVLAGDDEALVKAIREQVRPPNAEGVGAIYATFAAKGGVGATTIAVNLAGALQRRGQRTCIVDLDLNMGDVLAFLDLAGGYSISDVVANMRRLDEDLLDATLLKHTSGIHVLSQTHRVEESDRVDPSMIGALLHFLRRHYDVVVVDGLRSFDDISLAAVDATDQILLVLSQEVPAVRDAKRCVHLFRRLGHEGKLRLVVNRFQRHLDITPEVIAETAGLPVSATMSNDYPTVVRCVNRGVLLVDDAPKVTVTRDLEGILAVLGPIAEPEAPSAKRSILKRFFAN
jgi:pilus assembly protein CpaE